MEKYILVKKEVGEVRITVPAKSKAKALYMADGDGLNQSSEKAVQLESSGGTR